MIGTLLLLCFIITVPKSFKKAGLKLIIENNQEGIVLFIMSKTMWWVGLCEIALIWTPEKYGIYLWITTLLCFVLTTISDRKYVFFGFKKKAFQLTKKIKTNP